MEMQVYTPHEVEAMLEQERQKAKAKGMIEAFHIALKCHSDSCTRGSFRIAIYNNILNLEGKDKERA